MTAEELQHRQKQQDELITAKLEITAKLLAADRKRAADVLLQLHYQLSRTTSSVTILAPKSPK